MQTGNDFSPDVSIDKSLRKLKMLSEDIQFSVAADKTDDRDRSIRNGVNPLQGEFWGQQHGGIALLLDEL
jgi:hypothetical protein